MTGHASVNRMQRSDSNTTHTTSSDQTFYWTFTVHVDDPDAELNLLDRFALWYWCTFVLRVRGDDTLCLCRIKLGRLCDRLETRACKPKLKKRFRRV